MHQGGEAIGNTMCTGTTDPSRGALEGVGSRGRHICRHHCSLIRGCFTLGSHLISPCLRFFILKGMTSILPTSWDDCDHSMVQWGLLAKSDLLLDIHELRMVSKWLPKSKTNPQTIFLVLPCSCPMVPDPGEPTAPASEGGGGWARNREQRTILLSNPYGSPSWWRQEIRELMKSEKFYTLSLKKRLCLYFLEVTQTSLQSAWDFIKGNRI